MKTMKLIQVMTLALLLLPFSKLNAQDNPEDQVLQSVQSMTQSCAQVRHALGSINSGNPSYPFLLNQRLSAIGAEILLIEPTIVELGNGDPDFDLLRQAMLNSFSELASLNSSIGEAIQQGNIQQMLAIRSNMFDEVNTFTLILTDIRAEIQTVKSRH